MVDDLQIALDEALHHLTQSDLLDVAARLHDETVRRSHSKSRIIATLTEHVPEGIVRSTSRDKLRHVLSLLGQPWNGKKPSLELQFENWLAGQVILYPLLAKTLKGLCARHGVATSGNKSELLTSLTAAVTTFDVIEQASANDLRRICEQFGLPTDGTQRTLADRIQQSWRTLFDGDDDDSSDEGEDSLASGDEGGEDDESGATDENADYFPWPSTAVMDQGSALAGRHFDYQDGVLSFLGYQVGKTSPLSVGERRLVLDYVYFEELPQVQSRTYMNGWGGADTSNRLKKMADSIASFTRDAKRKDIKSGKKVYKVAVSHWEADLAYLKREYYDGVYDSRFPWPDTDT